MAYILFANPGILAAAGVPFDFLMVQQVTRIDFHALDTAIPEFVILLPIR